MKKLRILVADDHALVRRGVRTVLHSRPGWRVVGEATNGREAAEKAIELKPDVAIIDLGMPELDGVEQGNKGFSHPRSVVRKSANVSKDS